ncbi:MAG: ATP-binding protein [Spirochaetes bacterium]|nr:ATP-binding protein [Spirochaetota bacterium]
MGFSAMPNSNLQTGEINFIDSFSADTSVVGRVIDSLISDLKKMKFVAEEISEIVIAMDEAVTNAVQETLCNNRICLELRHDGAIRDITVRYRVTDSEFDATIIDHGKGLDIQKMTSITPDSASKGYHEQIFEYIDSRTEKKLHVTLNGREVILNGIGAGLKIILSFMDQVKIDLIDKESVVSTSVSDNTDGTIFNLKRRRRYL